MAKRRATLRIDIRDQRLPGGRFTCSARTTSAPEFRRREAAVRALIDMAAFDVLARITAPGKDRLHIAEVADAVKRGDVESLRVSRSEPLTLGRTADRLRTDKEATRRPGTTKQINVLLKQLEKFFGVERDKDKRIVRDVSLSSIDRQRCADFLHAKWGGRPWAPRTQAVKLVYAKELWAAAIRDEADLAERENRKPRLRRNPWDGVEAAEIIPTRVIFLTAVERDALLRKIEGTPLCAFMAVAYHAGLRLQEAINLRTGIDVDLPNRLLRIQSRPGQWAWAPKSNKGQRDVPINSDLMRYLEAHIDLGYAGQRYFFHTPSHDRPMADSTARLWWIDAYESAGIKWGRSEVDSVVYHTGRHTFASLLVQQGVSPLIVAELLGDRYEEVIKTYGHLTPHNLRDAVRLLESVTVSAKSSTVPAPEAHNAA